MAIDQYEQQQEILLFDQIAIQNGRFVDF